ncbi:MAG: slipin family protein, partial [Burkholderia sp.]|nr:slipin family protein [Burkholderia sp.]
MCVDAGQRAACPVASHPDPLDACHPAVIEKKDKNMWKRHVVKKNERALLMSEGDFVKVLEPGVFKAF